MTCHGADPKACDTFRTSQDVVELVIKPCTERYGVCYAEFCHSFDPEYYVVHCWKALFSDLLLAVSTHASGFTQPKLDASHEQYVRRPEALLRPAHSMFRRIQACCRRGMSNGEALKTFQRVGHVVSKALLRRYLLHRPEAQCYEPAR